MNKVVRPPATRSDIGPNIVRAWFDSVINPLLRALERERELLKEGNWTWRFRPSALEWVRPAQAYLAPDARDNLKHFVVLNPFVKVVMGRHDQKVPLLMEACQRYHQAVSADESFRRLYRKATSPQSLAEMGVERLSDLFGAYPSVDHLALLAQYVVNNTGELPAHYTPAQLWNRHRGEFLAVRQRPKVRLYYGSATSTGQALLREVNRLVALLERRRLHLSLEHDQPYAAAK
ncbi:MAG: hypothetical protein AAB225_17990 [Acidobacteriota bacterium]